MSEPFAIALAASVPVPVLTIGSGLPTEIEGQPVAYRRKEIARAGKYMHRGTRKEFELTPARLAQLSAAFRKRFAKGIRPPITPYHVDPEAEFNADDTLGYVVGVEQDGDSLYGTLQLIGERALSAAARNDVSIATVADAVDADGERYGECLHHLSMTPDPALSHLKPYLKIAASAGGGPARKALILSAATADRSTLMSPKTIARLRAKFNLDEDVKDEDVAERAAALALADPPEPPPPDETTVKLSATYKALAQEKDRLEAESETLRLSAAKAPREPDDLTLTMYAENMAAKREAAIATGFVSEAEAKMVDDLLVDAAGRPTALCLSATGKGRRPLGFQIWDVLTRIGKAKPGNRIKTGLQLAAAPEHKSYDPDDKPEEKPITPERRKELLAHIGA